MPPTNVKSHLGWTTPTCRGPCTACPPARDEANPKAEAIDLCCCRCGAGGHLPLAFLPAAVLAFTAVQVRACRTGYERQPAASPTSRRRIVPCRAVPCRAVPLRRNKRRQKGAVMQHESTHLHWDDALFDYELLAYMHTCMYNSQGSCLVPPRLPKLPVTGTLTSSSSSATRRTCPGSGR
jgi:hypothetical protein